MNVQDSSSQPFFIKRLVANIECANCGTQYELGNIHVIGHRGDLWITAVVCGQCGTQGLIFAMVKEERIDELTVRDASVEELLGFEELSAIEIDDVLDMHRFLKEYDGDLVSLLNETDTPQS